MLEARADSVLAEVADEDGRTLGIIAVPVEAAKRVERPEQRRLSV